MISYQLVFVFYWILFLILEIIYILILNNKFFSFNIFVRYYIKLFFIKNFINIAKFY